MVTNRGCRQKGVARYPRHRLITVEGEGPHPSSGSASGEVSGRLEGNCLLERAVDLLDPH
jgi:hypothetical protein